MKKLIKKALRRKEAPPPSRITVETIEQHREHILAGGRKFKYPVQYARHKLVINAILISIVSLLIAVAIGWWQLYPMQNTTEFIYKVTKVLPLPVAYVDGQPVLYSDYLMKYRSLIHYAEQKEQVNLKTDSGKRQIEYMKQQSISDAVSDSYANKLANNLKLSVSDAELEAFIKQDRQSVNGEVSEQTLYAVILDYHNWSPSEYRYAKKNKLLLNKVSYAIDKGSIKASDLINKDLKANPNVDLKTLASSVEKSTGVGVKYSMSGWVKKTNQDGGMAIEAAKLSKLGVSSVQKSTVGSGYFVVRLLNSSANQVNYEYINIPLTEFNAQLKKIEDSGKVNIFISVPLSFVNK